MGVRVRFGACCKAQNDKGSIVVGFGWTAAEFFRGFQERSGDAFCRSVRREIAEYLREPVEAEFFVLGVHGFKNSVRCEDEDVAGLQAQGYRFVGNVGKHAKWHSIDL